MYMLYRWIISCYFLGWLIASWIYSSPRYITYLTNWGFITYNTYLLVAALSTMVSYFTDYREDKKPSRGAEPNYERPSGCCGPRVNTLRWYQRIQWFLFTIGNELAFGIMCLFWTLLYRGGEFEKFSANVHLLNGLVAFIDFWVTAMPINILHVFYLMAYGVVYSLFNGIYFAATGNIVYPVIDYGNKIGEAIGLVISSVFLVLPAIHFTFYLMYLLKLWILHCCFGTRQFTQDEESRPIVEKEFETYSTEAKPV